ncbi:LptA/OstA family protein [Akkermansia glycaniphila]|uniref:Osta-like protein n=1 Tax=Akkermansia glycaniphila TaxID=1679444 RepID=A0A1C7PEA6_9BACT|nr:LptA/OstA family protein [Akkermansia glycaniphila]MBT9449474.1 hypothetical protein [Akkermansia glycaniphila]OCA03699.1 hypothetical protein AC781_03130 [Akkermansia glycaniphila]SEH82363.1 osta-like protein [Akkermansia glycaniphila]
MRRRLLTLCALLGLACTLPDGMAAAQPPANEDDPYGITLGEMTVITSDDAYINNKQGIIVFLDNISLRDPRLNIDCTDQMQIHFEKEEEPEASDDNKQTPAAKPAKTSNVDNVESKFEAMKFLIAEGNVVVHGKDRQGRPYRAYGDKIIIDGKTGEGILTGTTAIVIREQDALRAEGPNTCIHLHPDGSVFVESDKTRTQIIKPERHKTTKEPHPTA